MGWTTKLDLPTACRYSQETESDLWNPAGVRLLLWDTHPWVWTMFCIPMQIHRQSSVRPVTAYMFKQSDSKQINRYILHTSRNFAQGRLVSLCQFTLTVGEHSEVCFKITMCPSFFAGTSPSNTSVDSKNIIPSCLFSTQKIFASCSIYFFGFYKKLSEITMLWMGKPTISMARFNRFLYVYHVG